MRCFDLSRSIDLHTISTSNTHERAIAGVTKGLIGLNEIVTWQARHFGIWQELTTKITAMEPGVSFTDEMTQGAFKKITHHHYFRTENGKTKMRDEFNYESPFGLLGKLANVVILNRYMYKFLEQRNSIIKSYAESDRWKEVLDQV